MNYLELNRIELPVNNDEDGLKEDKNNCINDILCIFFILLYKME